MIAVLTLVLGMGVLLFGGYWLVDGAVRIARRLGMSTLLIGLTVVAFGTSAPELAFNVTAAVKGSSGLSFGNVVGSNIANIALVLGLAALVRPLFVHGRVVKRELPLLITITLVSVALAWRQFTPATSGDGAIAAYNRIDGIILLALFALLAWQWIQAGIADGPDPLATEAATKAHPEIDEDPERRRDSGRMAVASGMFLTGLVALVLGADLAETGAVDVARALGLSETVIGLTIIAFATSLPEVVTSLIAARKGHGDLAVGNIVGSNLFNLCLVLGVTATVSPVEIPPRWGMWDLGVMTLLTIVLLPMAVSNKGHITKIEGVFLVICYVGYMTFTVVRS
jgi:cation:H+ antiporter